MEIHNMSTTILTQLERTVLGLGIKYLPLPNTLPMKLYPSIDDSINKLHRTFRLAFYFADSPSTKNLIPKNETKALFIPDDNNITDPILTDYIKTIKSTVTNTLLRSRSLFSNTDNIILNTLNNIKNNTKITIKPADKNLGLVIMDTSHYKQLCLSHLLDTSTYQPIDNYSPKHAYAKLKLILNNHNLYWRDNNRRTNRTPLSLSLLQLFEHDKLRIPNLYILPKIHKTPMQSRPIVSSISSLTYHTSLYLDKLLYPVLKKLSTVCTSSQQLIFDWELIQCRKNSVILCADVTALYPNIPTQFGLQIVREVLEDIRHFTREELDQVMDLLHWVLTNNYCIYDGQVYLQIKGTAMGTPVAVSYANIFLYGIETKILAKTQYTYYKRFIDDVFSIWDTPDLANSYIIQFNNVCPTIKFGAITIGRDGIMLDLPVALQEIFDSGHTSTYDTVTHKLYQKERNIYQYIPPISEHKKNIFENFMAQELRRYKLSCTNSEDFDVMLDLKIVLNIGRLIKILGSLNILPHLIVGESLGTQSEIIG